MTIKQEKFCLKYAETGNATQSYMDAGYSGTRATAGVEGSKLLNNPNISARIKEVQDKAAEATGVSIAWILQRFKDISDRCMTAEPVMRFDPIEKKMVQETILNEFQEEVGVYSFDSNGANKATEALGKHLGFFATDNNQKAPDINSVQIIQLPDNGRNSNNPTKKAE